MVNEKFRENVPAWSSFSVRAEALPALFERIFALRAPATGPGGRPWHTHERVTYLVFAIHAFQSLENEAVRRQVLRLVSLPLWHALSRGRLQVCRPTPNCKRSAQFICADRCGTCGWSLPCLLAAPAAVGSHMCCARSLIPLPAELCECEGGPAARSWSCKRMRCW